MNSHELDEWLSRPTAGVRSALEQVTGDILILGAGGKMGPTLARMARRALPADRQVYAVSGFGTGTARRELETHGVRTISCDLLNHDAVKQLPDAANVIFMTGQKFGTRDAPGLTWMINCVVPAIAAERFAKSRIVVFSTGCVYPFTDVTAGGSVETDELNPPGEYAYSCVARERIFTHYSQSKGTPILIFRLNYAIDLRYGVLHDIASKVWQGIPVDVTMGHVNFIWQGDANARALQSLAYTSQPPAVVNVTGRECLSVRQLAIRFGDLFGRTPILTGQEAATAWLSNATKSFEWFGDITVAVDEMLQATADWIRQGGQSLGKPTHFESHDGRF
jgi:nucleoside-diphosphate-sugar epimerase